MGPFKHEQKQSHEFWWSLLLPCRNSEAVYGHPGHNGPPLTLKRVKIFSNLSKFFGIFWNLLEYLSSFVGLGLRSSSEYLAAPGASWAP